MELLLEALGSGRSHSAPGRAASNTLSRHAAHRWGGLAALPALFAGAIIPRVCPACWSAYAGLLSAIGLGFLTSMKILLPEMLVGLLLALGLLAWKANHRRGYLPFLLGAIASVLVLYRVFYIDSTTVYYCGILLLLASCIWNAWPRRIGLACKHCRAADENVSFRA